MFNRDLIYVYKNDDDDDYNDDRCMLPFFICLHIGRLIIDEKSINTQLHYMAF